MLLGWFAEKYVRKRSMAKFIHDNSLPNKSSDPWKRLNKNFHFLKKKIGLHIEKSDPFTQAAVFKVIERYSGKWY